jgi:outer membrane lipoprotein-sorting protein
MKKRIVLLSIAMLSMFLIGTASALEFSSDTIMTGSGRSVKGKIFMKDKKMRMENKGMPGYNIIRSDRNLMWMVMPSSKSYMEMKVDPANKPKTEEKIAGEITRKKIGSETINGHPTDKYEITYTNKGKTDKMYQWMATDIKFPVKTAAVDGSFSQEYKNIKMGGQPDSLFEVPSGYKKMTMPAMPKGLDGR